MMIGTTRSPFARFLLQIASMLMPMSPMMRVMSPARRDDRAVHAQVTGGLDLFLGRIGRSRSHPAGTPDAARGWSIGGERAHDVDQVGVTADAVGSARRRRRRTASADGVTFHEHRVHQHRRRWR